MVPHHARMDGRQQAARAVIARRGELGMTQQELADAAEIDIKTIGNLESRGRWPIAKNRARIEKALGWPQGELARLASQDGEEKPVMRPGLYRQLLKEVGEEDAAAVVEFLAERRRENEK